MWCATTITLCAITAWSIATTITTTTTSTSAAAAIPAPAGAHLSPSRRHGALAGAGSSCAQLPGAPGNTTGLS